MTGLTIGTQVHFGQTGVIATIIEVRTATDGSWTDYRLELPSGGLMWADSRKCEPVTDDSADPIPAPTAPTLPVPTPAPITRWSSADLALFLTCGSLDARSSAECFTELQTRGVPMVSDVPVCEHAEHMIDQRGDRIGVVDAHAYTWEVCALHTFGA